MKNQKVDLKSVNKKGTKRTPSLAKVTPKLKRSKGPKRDVEGKFTSGSGGLLQKTKIKWSRVLPIVLVVSLVGGFLVYQTSAAGNYTAFITGLYQSCLGRAPDAAGLQYWEKELSSGRRTQANVAAAIKGQSAYRNAAQCGGGAATSSSSNTASGNTASGTPTQPSADNTGYYDFQFVRDLYLWCLNYRGDTAGRLYWERELSSGRRTREQVRQYFASISPNGCAYGQQLQFGGRFRTQEQYDAYKQAMAQLKAYFADKFWALYEARGGQLDDSERAPNLRNSCQQAIREVQQGTRARDNVGLCYPLVEMLNSNEPDPYAVQIGRGTMTVAQAIEEIENPPTNLLQGCSPDTSLIDCYYNRWNNITSSGQGGDITALPRVSPTTRYYTNSPSPQIVVDPQSGAQRSETVSEVRQRINVYQSGNAFRNQHVTSKN